MATTEIGKPFVSEAPVKKESRQIDGIVRERTSLYMKGGVVYNAETNQRVIRSSQDLGIFDGNKGIAERRAKSLPKGTKIYEKS